MDRKQITVPLAKPDSSAAVTPREVVFSPASGTIFVRASGSSDVFAELMPVGVYSMDWSPPSSP